MIEWRIGCSGYRYPEWKRLFYPEELAEGRWLEYYSRYFNTVELNITYYRSPRMEVLRSLRERTPDDFFFTVKAPRRIMRARRFGEAQRLAGEFSECMQEGLADKLGAVLFQLSAEHTYDAEQLLRLTEMLDPAVRNVIEFRHSSWWNPEVFGVLERAGIAFAGISHPDLPQAVVNTTDTVYYRLHGIPYRYSSGYSQNALEDLTQAIASRPGIRRACIYFNNPAQGHAVTNARQLQEICAYVH